MMSKEKKNEAIVNQCVEQSFKPVVVEYPSIERPFSLKRILVELMFYVILILSIFTPLTGIHSIPFVAGSIVLAGGIITIFISSYMQKEKIPASFWFILIIVFMANLSQIIGHNERPIIGHGLSAMLHLLILFTMMWYLILNKSTENRLLIYFFILIILTVLLSGTYEEGRLALKEGIGDAFRNANDLAYMAGLFSIAFLFWSLTTNKATRPFLLLISLLLFLILFQTTSRGGLAIFACGLIILLVSILIDRKVRMTGIIAFSIVSFLIIVILNYYIGEYWEFLRERIHEPSERLDVYSKETLIDLNETIILGKGFSYLPRAGIYAHNSFLFTHMTFGGITAWPYLFWLIYLSIRVFRLLFIKELSIHLRMKVLCLFGMSLGSQFFSNQGYNLFSTIYAVAIVEKYTSFLNKSNLEKPEVIRKKLISRDDREDIGVYTE